MWGPECTSAKNTDYIAAATGLGLLNAVATHSYGCSVGDLPASDRNSLPAHMTEYSLYDDDTNNQINGVLSQPLMAAKTVDHILQRRQRRSGRLLVLVELCRHQRRQQQSQHRPVPDHRQPCLQPQLGVHLR